MSRPILATISQAALRHNYGAAKRAAPRSKVYAVVKANGYGHGRERVVRMLGPQTDGFAMVELEGAVATREGGYPGPILLLEGFFEPAELPYIAHSDLATVVHDEEQIRMLEAARLERAIDVFFKINTGMNRLGFAPDAVGPQLERLRRANVARSITLLTHFAMSEKAGGIDEAMRRFDQATRGIELARSLSNTAAIFSQARAHGDIARLGIGLYGATPFSDRSAESLGLKPAMTLSSHLIAIQQLTPGEAIGYGAMFRAGRNMRIGVVACGYADGYPRHAPSGTPILVGGVRTATVGRVSMDMITVDLAGIPDARVGTPVTLWGEGVPIDDVAAPAGTVGYELMCALGQRVPVVEAAA